MTFTVKANSVQSNGESVSIPASSSNDDKFNSGFVTITVGSKSLTLAVQVREGAAGNELWVSPGLFGLTAGHSVNASHIVKATEFKYRRDRVFKTVGGQISFWGLMSAIIGIGIKASFSIGATGYVWKMVTVSQEAGLMAAASILEVLGVALVFYRGIWLGLK